MKRPVSLTVGVVLAAILAVMDLAPLAFVSADSALPYGLVLVGAVLGLITLVGVWLGWGSGRRRAGVAIIVSTRLLAALTAVPAFFVEDAPEGAVPAAVIGIAVTLVCVALVAPALRQRDVVVA